MNPLERLLSDAHRRETDAQHMAHLRTLGIAKSGDGGGGLIPLETPKQRGRPYPVRPATSFFHKFGSPKPRALDVGGCGVAMNRPPPATANDNTPGDAA